MWYKTHLAVGEGRRDEKDDSLKAVDGQNSRR